MQPLDVEDVVLHPWRDMRGGAAGAGALGEPGVTQGGPSPSAHAKAAMQQHQQQQQYVSGSIAAPGAIRSSCGWDVHALVALAAAFTQLGYTGAEAVMSPLAAALSHTAVQQQLSSLELLQFLRACLRQPAPSTAACQSLAAACLQRVRAWLPAQGAGADAGGDSSIAPEEAEALGEALAAMASQPLLLRDAELCSAASELLRQHLHAERSGGRVFGGGSSGRGGRLKPRACVDLLQPLVAMGVPGSRQLAAELAGELLARQALPEFAPNPTHISDTMLSGVAWCCARSGAYDPGSVAAIAALAGRLAEAAQKAVPAALRTSQAVRLFWALSVLQHRGPAPYEALLQLLLRRYDLRARELLLLQDSLQVSSPPRLSPRGTPSHPALLSWDTLCSNNVRLFMTPILLTHDHAPKEGGCIL